MNDFAKYIRRPNIDLAKLSAWLTDHGALCVCVPCLTKDPFKGYYAETGGSE